MPPRRGRSVVPKVNRAQRLDARILTRETSELRVMNALYRIELDRLNQERDRLNQERDRLKQERARLEKVQPRPELYYLTRETLEKAVEEIKNSPTFIVQGECFEGFRKLPRSDVKTVLLDLLTIFKDPKYNRDYTLLSLSLRIVVSILYPIDPAKSEDEPKGSKSSLTQCFFKIKPIVTSVLDLTSRLREADIFLSSRLKGYFLTATAYEIQRFDSTLWHDFPHANPPYDEGCADDFDVYYIKFIYHVFEVIGVPIKKLYSSCLFIRDDAVIKSKIDRNAEGWEQKTSENIMEDFAREAFPDGYDINGKDDRGIRRHLLRNGLIREGADLQCIRDAYKDEIRDYITNFNKCPAGSRQEIELGALSPIPKAAAEWCQKLQGNTELLPVSFVHVKCGIEDCIDEDAVELDQIFKKNTEPELGGILLQLFEYSLLGGLSTSILSNLRITMILELDMDGLSSPLYESAIEELNVKVKEYSALWDRCEMTKTEIEDRKKNNQEYGDHEKKLRNLRHELLDLRSSPLVPVPYSVRLIKPSDGGYITLAVLFADLCAKFSRTATERREQMEKTRKISKTLVRHPDFTRDESEERLALRVALDADYNAYSEYYYDEPEYLPTFEAVSPYFETKRSVDPLSDGGPRRMVDCRVEKWTGFKLLQDETHRSQIYQFDYETISNYIPDLKTNNKVNKLKPTDQIIMKIYNIDLAKVHYLERFQWNARPCGLRGFEREFDQEYFCEVESYRRIIKYNNENPSEKINIPEIYQCGSIRVHEDCGFALAGFFILMEYIDSQPLSNLTEDTLSKGESTLAKIRRLLISYPMQIQNLLLRNEEIFFIDFSDSNFSTYDNSKLSHIWNKVYPKKSNEKRKFRTTVENLKRMKLVTERDHQTTKEKN